MFPTAKSGVDRPLMLPYDEGRLHVAERIPVPRILLLTCVLHVEQQAVAHHPLIAELVGRAGPVVQPHWLYRLDTAA
jgi:hypothetical protein